jgi:hypothetical protein
MSPRTIRHLTRLGHLATLIVALGGAVAVGALLRPLPAWTPPRVELGPVTSRPSAKEGEVGPEQLAVIWQRDLRQPLTDPPAVPSPAEPQLSLQLVGTAIEGQRCFGLFQTGKSAVVVKPVGGEIDGIEILEITRGRARVRAGGREYELRVPWYDRIQEAEGRREH